MNKLFHFGFTAPRLVIFSLSMPFLISSNKLRENNEIHSYTYRHVACDFPRDQPHKFALLIAE